MDQKKTEPVVKWTETVIPRSEGNTHKHYFEWREGECKCKFCSFGLKGVIEIVDGKPS